MVPPARSANRWRQRRVTAKESPFEFPTAQGPTPVTFPGGSSDAAQTSSSVATGILRFAESSCASVQPPSPWREEGRAHTQDLTVVDAGRTSTPVDFGDALLYCPR